MLSVKIELLAYLVQNLLCQSCNRLAQLVENVMKRQFKFFDERIYQIVEGMDGWETWKTAPFEFSYRKLHLLDGYVLRLLTVFVIQCFLQNPVDVLRGLADLLLTFEGCQVALQTFFELSQKL